MILSRSNCDNCFILRYAEIMQFLIIRISLNRWYLGQAAETFFESAVADRLSLDSRKDSFLRVVLVVRRRTLRRSLMSC